MIKRINHISIISSSERSIDFYQKLGFEVSEAVDRGYDKIYYLSGYETELEIYVDPTHPPRTTCPEALGLRHLAFTVDSIEKTIESLGVEAEPVRTGKHGLFTFIKDPDLLPIELLQINS